MSIILILVEELVWIVFLRVGHKTVYILIVLCFLENFQPILDFSKGAISTKYAVLSVVWVIKETVHPNKNNDFYTDEESSQKKWGLSICAPSFTKLRSYKFKLSRTTNEASFAQCWREVWPISGIILHCCVSELSGWNISMVIKLKFREIHFQFLS